MKEPFIFNLANATEAVVTRSQIFTNIPSTGEYSIQVVTMALPYRSTALSHAVRLGVAGTNNFFQFAWGPQDHDEPAYIPLGNSNMDLLSHREMSLLETAQAHHAALFQGQENTAALLSAIETLTKRATAVLAKQLE